MVQPTASKAVTCDDDATNGTLFCVPQTDETIGKTHTRAPARAGKNFSRRNNV